MFKIRGLRKFILLQTGADNSFEIEHRLFNQVSFFAGIVGVCTVIINLIIGSSIQITIASFAVSLVCWTVFYLSRIKRKFNLGRWILTLFLFIMFSFLFYINNGSQGPLLHLYLVFFALIVFIWDRKTVWIFVSLFVLNIIGFYYIESTRPGLIEEYPSDSMRFADVYFSYFLYILLVGLMLNFAKVSYIKERRKAERADHLKSAFLANMSHEIRTPMNSILGFTQLLKQDLPKDKHEDYIRMVQTNGESLLRLIEDIIDFSKIEAGELSFHEDYCNINQLVREVTESTRQNLRGFPDKKVEIELVLPTESWQINTDITRVRQVLTNLASNAVKFTHEGYVRIGFTRVGSWIKFFVSDTGIGIRQENQEEIFERFRKIESESLLFNSSGTGIGLSISRNLVKMMGGVIGLESEFGKGSEFHFTIPAKEAKLLEFSEPRRKKLVKPRIKNLDEMLVLVAEDERANFLFLRRVLEDVGARILHAWDGEEALRLFDAHKDIDIVLLDIMMPVMDGLEAVKEMKKRRPSVPVIAQTALAMQGDERTVLNAGCDDYISKPIKVDTLIQKLDSILKE